METLFITGADKGIGMAIFERLASQFQTAIFTYNTNKDGAEAIVSKVPNAVSFQCDLSNRDQTVEIAEIVLQKYGSVDVLINNAGYDHDSVFTKMTADQWDSVLDVNLRSIFNLTHMFVNGMVKNGWGRIINLTSIAGYTGAFGKSNYAAAKAGVVGFTKSLAMELGSKGITVNAVAPGAIKTDMLMRIPEKYLEQILTNIPIHRFGEPSEVADLVEFLTSNKASYINGQTIHINGGSYCL